MITPAEVTWPIAGLLLVAVLAGIWLLLGHASSSIPSVPVGYSIERTAAQHIEQSIGACSWAQLAAEATRTDTLLWYASRVLDRP